MHLSEESIKEFQELYKKKFGKYLSYKEATESTRNLMGLAEVLYESNLEEYRRKKKLEEFPKGFKLEGVGYTCFICHQSTQAGENWYDKYGIKCLICQKAVDKKIIPASAAKSSDSWYSKYDLETRFNIDRQALTQFIKHGILKPRIVTNENSKPHYYLFLIKDNKYTLPPKKLTESKHVSYKGDKKGVVHVESWYKFVNPYEHLRGYKILDYLNFTYEEG